MIELATRQHSPAPAPDVIERVIAVGDLAKLSPEQRARYYVKVCESVGLNPLTRPLEYIVLNGKLTLYARKDAADQLRRLHGVSLEIVSRETVDDIYVVHVRARLPDGRTDEDEGGASVANLRGDALVNARLKAVTKAKRRVTLSVCGLGWLDESEVEAIPDARPVRVDHETGVIHEPSPAQSQPALPPESTPRAADGTPRAEQTEYQPQLVSERQRRALHKIAADRHGWDHEQLSAFCVQRYGIRTGGLSRTQASELIDQLQSAERGVLKAPAVRSERAQAVVDEMDDALAQDEQPPKTWDGEVPPEEETGQPALGLGGPPESEALRRARDLHARLAAAGVAVFPPDANWTDDVAEDWIRRWTPKLEQVVRQKAGRR